MKDFGYGSPVRLFIALKALNQGSYQYLLDNLGVKACYDYLTRFTLKEFMRRCPWEFDGHEVMLPDRVLPQQIKAIAVKTPKIKDQIIAHLRKKQLFQTDQSGQETFNGIPIDEFIMTTKYVAPDYVKRC